MTHGVDDVASFFGRLKYVGIKNSTLVFHFEQVMKRFLCLSHGYRARFFPQSAQFDTNTVYFTIGKYAREFGNIFFFFKNADYVKIHTYAFKFLRYRLKLHAREK